MGIEQYNDTIWRVNAQKSESMEEILTAQGIGFLKRKLILSVMDSVTSFFNTDGVNFHIKMEGLKFVFFTLIFFFLFFSCYFRNI